jgi:hypothetical protein
MCPFFNNAPPNPPYNSVTTSPLSMVDVSTETIPVILDIAQTNRIDVTTVEVQDNKTSNNNLVEITTNNMAVPALEGWSEC